MLCPSLTGPSSWGAGRRAAAFQLAQGWSQKAGIQTAGLFGDRQSQAFSKHGSTAAIQFVELRVLVDAWPWASLLRSGCDQRCFDHPNVQPKQGNAYIPGVAPWMKGQKKSGSCVRVQLPPLQAMWANTHAAADHNVPFLYITHL